MIPYYQDDLVTIYHGDALEILPAIVEAGVVLLDPPYSMVPNSFAGRDDGVAGTSGAPMMLLTEALRHTRRLLPEGGIAGLICDWRRIPDVSYMVTLTGLRISTCIAWTRSTAGMGGLFRSAWDPILVLSAGSAEAKDRAAVRNVIHTTERGRTGHPYEKPVAVWQHILDRVRPTVVVDPFTGSGSGLLAARVAGHTAIGIEVSEAYCEIAANRCRQEVLGLTR